MTFAGLTSGTDVALLAVFGISTTYQPKVGSAKAVTGIFEDEYVRAGKGLFDTGVSSTAPAVFYRMVDLPADPNSDSPTITINSIAYSVIETEPDDQGGILLVLHRN